MMVLISSQTKWRIHVATGAFYSGTIPVAYKGSPPAVQSGACTSRGAGYAEWQMGQLAPFSAVRTMNGTEQ